MSTAEYKLSQEFFGLKGAPGIVMGRVVVVDQQVNWQKRRLKREEIPLEVQRLKIAVARSEHQLMDIRDQFDEHLEDYSSIINNHILILKDSLFSRKIMELIESESINAEWALDKAMKEVEARFSRLSDSYIRERFADVRHVAERVLRLLGGGDEKVAYFDSKVILLARDFSPEDTLRMNQDLILGFMTEMGGVTSHTAIVARSLGIPAVVGLDKIIDLVETGDMAILDGNSGRVFINPSQERLNSYREIQSRQLRYDEHLSLFVHLPSETIDGLQVQVKANIEIVDELTQAVKYGAAGIGLFRSEYYFVGRDQPPEEDFLFEVYHQLVSTLAPFPVTIRTFDLGGDKFWSGGNWPDETNPALGLRAIRFSLREPRYFEIQLRALFRAGYYGNLRILLPMISSLDELLKAREVMDKVRADLRREGLAHGEDVQIGIMIEVPSAVAVADILARQVDFFSIGTNDLIQYGLAIDRGNESVAHMYEPLHPGVLRMIRQVVDAGHESGIEVGICGEMAGDTTFLPVLLGLGLDELSMHPLAIPYIKRMIRNSTAEEVERLTRKVFTFQESNEIRNYLCGYLPKMYPEEFGSKYILRFQAA